MPTRLSNLNFFIPKRSPLFGFGAIAHVGDLLVSHRGGAPTFSFELAANRNDVIKGGKKDNGVPCDVGSNSIRAATSPPSTSCIAISLDRKFTRRFSKEFRGRVKTHEQQGES